ncbi:MAG: FKBP-type peptidyl-prolyl cis-trans isomerase [Polaribacter sp.]
MNKIKYILSILTLSIILVSCDNATIVNPFANLDYEEIAINDNDSIIAFLKNNYYDASKDSIKPLVSGKTSIFSDNNKLKTLTVTENDINYKLYVYVAEEGNPKPDKGFPTVVDSVFVKYEGRVLLNSTTLSSSFDSNTQFWFTLNSVVRGWTYGFNKFKGGELKKDSNGGPFNGPITYLNGGKGVLFIPSGLAYPSSDVNNIQRVPSLVDDVLVFYVELFDHVENTDTDQDGIPSMMEDLDGDGEPRNDDTDGDGIPNFADIDDDNDGVLTKDEDKNGDGNPANDFNDPAKPTVPDYLNPDIK